MITLNDFLAAIDSGYDLKVLSKLLKELPSEDKKEAGLAFQKLKNSQVQKSKNSVNQSVNRKYGKWLWSSGIILGQDSYPIDVYENAIIIHSHWLGKAVLVTGTDLGIKEITTNPFELFPWIKFSPGAHAEIIRG